MPKKGTPKPGARGPRPHVWKCGTDEYKHSMYIPWLKAKAQANFRDEEWHLSFDDWFKLWDGRWHLRGRDSTNLCLARMDMNGAWEVANVKIMTIHERRIKQALDTVTQRRSQGHYPKHQSTRQRDLEKIKYKKMVVMK